MIACLGRMHEFEAHFRGALRNGLTPKELAAILRQIAVYSQETLSHLWRNNDIEMVVFLS